MHNLICFLIGRFTSLLGNGLMDIVLPIYILELTSSGSKLGGFVAIIAIPSLILTPIFGNYLEKFNKKQVMILSDILQGLLFLCLFLLRDINLVVLGLFMVISIMIEKIFEVSSSAIFSQIIEEKYIETGNSLKSILDNIASIASPMIGTFLYYTLGMKGIFIINAVTYLLSAMLECFIKYNFNHMEIQKQTMITNLKEVCIFVFKDSILSKLFIAVMLLNFIIAPLSSVILPYLLLEVQGLSSYQFGIGNSAFMLGSMIGASLIMIKKNKIKLTTLLNFNSVLFILMGILSYSLLGQTSTIFLILIAIKLFTGTGVTMVNIPLISSFQKMVPTKMQSRFFALLSFTGGLLIPLGELGFGLLSDHINSHIILVLAGGLMILMTYLLLMRTNKGHSPNT